MKRISHIAVLAALAFGAQTAWSSDNTTSERLVVAAIGGSYAEQTGAVQSAKAESMLEKLGYVANDGFPSRGGPIDN